MFPSSNLALDYEPEIGSGINVQALRRWCTPTLILAVTDLADEEKLLFHAIRQAMPGNAKLLLAHVLPQGRAARRSRSKIAAGENISTAKSVHAALERMARQLRWVGIACEPILLRGAPAEEIAALAGSSGTERVLLTLQDEERPDSNRLTLAEELLSGIGIPLCTLGRRMPTIPQSEPSAGRVTLALSLRSESEVPLAYACRLAQELHAKLTVMHVFDPAEELKVKMTPTPAAVALRLPARLLREAELLCPLEFVVREGDAATEILAHVNSTKQDFVVLGPIGPSRAGSSGSAMVAKKIMDGAGCPVLLLGDGIFASARSDVDMVGDPIPPYAVRR